MRIAMTLMVRDEADVIGPMLAHHAAQGVDVFIITDNGSVDGTLEQIESFAQDHEVDLRVDPVHRKQQSRLVTGMARDAATRHRADWVINADADEFWVPTGDGTIAERFGRYPDDLAVFQAPVVDMTGEPAESGTGLDRLVWRDARPVEEINRVGIRAHSSPNAVHRADAEIIVAQGNHEVNRPAGKHPADDLAIEVLHLPWRSWSQFRRKVENAGLAYAANPELTPSVNHHGMRDYRRLQEGSLLSAYVTRHPTPDELRAGEADGWFVRDDRLALSSLPRTPDTELAGDLDLLRRQGRALVEREHLMIAQRDDALAEAHALQVELGAVRQSHDALSQQVRELSTQLQQYRNRRAVRVADALRRRTDGA